MDILTHTLSGVAVGTVIAAYAKPGFSRKAIVLFAGALGGAFPDIDAISMWSKFDNTFGRLFHLSHPGKYIYGAKYWYSHHAFFHSLAASLLIAILLGLTGYFLCKLMKHSSKQPVTSFFNSHKLLFIAFIAGYWMHLLGDIPTPASVWGGINLCWPLPNYSGGTGQIWWWNNYDIFLLILSAIFINILLLLVSPYCKLKSPIITLVVVFVAFFFIFLQINTRQYDYSYTGNSARYNEMELQSKKEQQRILGDTLYQFMERFDRKMKFFF